MDSISEHIEKIYRDHFGKLVARLVSYAGGMALAEEFVQFAFEKALIKWPDTGVPAQPVAWLFRTAANRALDSIRFRKMQTAKSVDLQYLAEVATARELPPLEDNLLRLIFTCCHPALGIDSQVALTLRVVCGVETFAIAKAYCEPVATIAQRIVRAKKKIRIANIPFVVPPEAQLVHRFEGVAQVVYLMFNEGYTASTGQDLLDVDLCRVAIELARNLVSLLPQQEMKAMLALLLFQHSRRKARAAADGSLIPLSNQDRTLWDYTIISEAQTLLQTVLQTGPVGRYALEAAIAGVHAAAPSDGQTDWEQIVGLYELLIARTGSAIAMLNRCVAVAMLHGPDKGLEQMRRDGLAESLDNYHLYHVACGFMHKQSGQVDKAKDCYRRAWGLTTNEQEKQHIMLQIDGC